MINVIIFICFIVAISTFTLSIDIVKALITGGLIGIWVSLLVKRLWKKS